jgi:hypothetical protein
MRDQASLSPILISMVGLLGGRRGFITDAH